MKFHIINFLDKNTLCVKFIFFGIFHFKYNELQQSVVFPGSCWGLPEERAVWTSVQQSIIRQSEQIDLMI